MATLIFKLDRALAVFGALPAMDMDLEALPINIGDLEEEGFMEPEAQAIHGGEGDLVVQGSGRLEEPSDLLHTEDSGELVDGRRAHEREGVPVALEDVLREAAEATVAEAHGRGGEAIDVFAVQERALERLFGEQVGRVVGALSQQADCPDRRFLRPFALATEVESRKHGWTQWGHEMSPSMR